ncbi:MAG: UDP-3-O-acyl-N-acetylglucosamine deacetylase [Vulcanimicrobiaceae bacterium]
MNAQRTLGDAVDFAGVGLHTGCVARVHVEPQPADAGLSFVLSDGEVTFPAHAEFVVDTRRATVLGIGDATVSTVEHLLSALVGSGIDNARITIDGPEVPILDGSAAEFAAAFARARIVAQHVPRATFTVDRPYVFADGDAMLVVSPADAFRLRFAVDFAPPVGAQFIDTSLDADAYVREIAPARTFGYLHEVEALRAAGLARGGSLDNALVFAPDGPMTPQRWPNEVVRHKALDLIGDFALLGAWPQCDIVSIKSGHRLHARATAALRGLARGAARGTASLAGKQP